jgi:hypothetical protein
MIKVKLAVNWSRMILRHIANSLSSRSYRKKFDGYPFTHALHSEVS